MFLVYHYENLGLPGFWEIKDGNYLSLAWAHLRDWIEIWEEKKKAASCNLLTSIRVLWKMECAYPLSSKMPEGYFGTTSEFYWTIGQGNVFNWQARGDATRQLAIGMFRASKETAKNSRKETNFKIESK